MKCVSGLTALSLVLATTILVFAQEGDVPVANLPSQKVSDSSSYYQPIQQRGQAGQLDETQQTRPFGPWPKKTIRDIETDVRDGSEVVPEDRFAELAKNSQSEDWRSFYPAPRVFAWSAPDIRYQPLYFEDVPLERYGQTAGWYKQPIYSALFFAQSMFTLPNQMRHDPPYSCDYPLGFCRPGARVPSTKQRQYFGIFTR